MNNNTPKALIHGTERPLQHDPNPNVEWLCSWEPLCMGSAVCQRYDARVGIWVDCCEDHGKQTPR